MDFRDAQIRVDVTLGDIASALEGWETHDIGKLVGLMLFGVNSYSARDFLHNELAPRRDDVAPTLSAVLDGLYEYARGLADALKEAEV